jgi:hypothetical protein
LGRRRWNAQHPCIRSCLSDPEQRSSTSRDAPASADGDAGREGSGGCAFPQVQCDFVARYRSGRDLGCRCGSRKLVARLRLDRGASTGRRVRDHVRAPTPTEAIASSRAAQRSPGRSRGDDRGDEPAQPLDRRLYVDGRPRRCRAALGFAGRPGMSPEFVAEETPLAKSTSSRATASSRAKGRPLRRESCAGSIPAASIIIIRTALRCGR